MKIDLLAIGVHPDDVELSCSGTLLRHLDMGRSVGLLDLTRGELGTRGTAEIRDKEAANAAALLGASFRKNLGMADGFFRNDKEHLLPIIQVIREHRPEIVLANAVKDRHSDHGRAAQLALDACFYAGLAKIETTGEDGLPQERWRPQAVYHYIQDYNLPADFVVDISNYIDRKIEVVLAFRSQFYAQDTGEFSDQLNTPISGKDFLDFLRAKARTYGRTSGFEYAEGFTVARTPGVTDLFSLS